MANAKMLYIAVCEFILALMSGAFGLVLFLGTPDAKDRRVAAAMIFVAVISISVGVGFLLRKRWAWFASLVIGPCTVALGGWIFWAAATAPETGDGGEAIAIAVPILLCALFACWLMMTSTANDFVSPQPD